MNRIKCGRAALAYLIGNGRGHNGQKVRNACISSVNMIPDGQWLRQFRQEWDRVNRQRHPTQAIGIIQSFSREELDPKNDEHIATANTLGNEFVKTYYPGRRALICTQIDGKSGLIHNHLLISDTEMTTLLGCNKNQYHKKTIERWSDEIISKYMVIDRGKKTTEKETKTERVKRETGAYVWKDALRERITAAISEAKTEEDFFKRLTAHGVEATKRSSKKRGEYFTYELLDFSDMPDGEEKPKHSKIRSYNLSAAFSPEAINAAIIEKQDISAHDVDTIAVSGNTHKKRNSKTESIAPETVSPYEPDFPLVPIPPPTDNDDEEIQRERKRNEKRRRAIQQELRKARHAELMARFSETPYKNNYKNNFELSL